jgi:hypothetical protein
MSSRILILIAALWVTGLPAQAPPKANKPAPKSPAWKAPRNQNGQPDLEGVWLSNGATPLERPKGLEGKAFLSDAEVVELKKRAAKLFKPDGSSDYAAGDNAFLAAFANVDLYKNPNISVGSSLEMVEREFDNRTSLIMDPPDGKIPALTPEGKRRQAAADAAAARPARGPEDLTNALRCITFGVPRLGGNFGSGPYSYYQIFQTRGYVVLYTEIIHEARMIPLDGRPHLPPNIRQLLGDSRGRWDGNSLVVDTTNFSGKSNFMGSADNLHLVERLTRVSPETIHYEITIEDPTIWTRPWTAMIRLKRSPENIFEFACHEGNETVMTGMLGAAHADAKALANRKK